MKIKRFLAAVVSLVMTVTMMPATAFAADGTTGGTEPTGSMVLSKTAELQDDGTYTIDLEAYSTGSTTITETTEKVPLDIVLVLDQSGSMDEDMGGAYTAQNSAGYSYSDINNSRTTYYYQTSDGNYYEVQAGRYRSGRNYQYYLYYTVDYTTYYLSGTGVTTTRPSNITDRYATIWTGVLYTRTTISRLDALKTAANTFIQSVQEDAETNTLDHKIAVVGFASGTWSESNTAWENTELLSTSSVVSYSGITAADYQAALVSANVGGEVNSRLTNAITRVDGSGATYINYGLEMAQGVLNNRTETTYVKTDGTTADRKTIVVVFTDGVPGKTTMDDHGFADYEEYNQIPTANKAIPIADNIKASGTTIYSVGIFEGADPSADYNFSEETASAGWWDSYTYYDTATQAANAFLHFLSSDYESAGSMTTPDRTSVVNNGYYLAASDSEGLSEVFEGIAGSITESGTAVKLTAESVMKDIMADGFDASNANVEVTTFAATMGDDGETVVKGAQTETANTLTSAISEDGKTVTVTGFDYSTKFVADKHPGEILHVTITEVVPTDAAVTGEIIGTNAEISGIYENSDAVEPTEKFDVPNTILTEKSYVLDFAKEVSLAGMDQDVSVNAVVETMGQVTASDSSVTGNYGNTALAEGSVTYEPKTTNWNGYDSFYAFGKTSDEDVLAASANANGNLWSKINVIPATSVYYEDDFGYTSSGSKEDGYTTIEYKGDWETATSAGASEEAQSSENIVYGTDSTYNDDLQYSDGSAHYAGLGATASFTFTGTGLEIYTTTNSESGRVIVQIKGQTTGKIYTAIVDNEFNSIEGGLYQIPTVFFQDVERDTYDATVTVIGDGEGNDTYYLDAIRVYNPLNGNDPIVSDAYGEANEADAVSEEVRQTLIDASTVDGEITAPIDGTVYIDSLGESTSEIGTYVSNGPKNEVYLEAGKSIAFQIDTEYTGQALLGIKAPSGTASSVDVTYGNDAKANIPITSATDMYYVIHPTDDGRVVITNKGDALISITKLRLTGVAAQGDGISLKSTPELMSYAASFTSLSYADNETVEDPDENTGDVDIENPQEPENPSDSETGHDTIKDTIGNVIDSLWDSIWNGFSSWFGR